MFLSWPMPVPLTTNCQRKKRQAIMKTQIRICLTVEFKRISSFPVCSGLHRPQDACQTRLAGAHNNGFREAHIVRR